MKKILTLTIVHNDDKILLGEKKRGFGLGKWNGFGGKVETGETIEAAAIRECYEEASIKVFNLSKVAIFDFIFAGSEEVLEVHVFKTNDFSGEPTESDEMRPAWFDFESIPFSQMWQDDAHWFPLVLNGKKLVGSFNFSAEQQLLDFDLKEIVSF